MRKKFVGFISMMLMVMVLSGCGAKSNPQTPGSPVAQPEAPKETYTIAVAWNQMSVETQQRIKYLEEAISPALDVEFIFSEELTDSESMMTFLENSYAAGADALYSTVTDGIDQVAARADELGMYTVFETSRFSEDIATIPTFLGITGINTNKVAEAYGDLLNEKFDSNTKKNFLVISGGAARGVMSHIQATTSMLSEIADIYGLTYDQDVAELAKLNATTDINTNSDIKITIVPGFPGMEGYNNGVSRLLQTGDYDVIVSVYQVTETFGTTVNEVEKALGKNISIINQASFSDVTKMAFATKDSTGNPTLDGAVLYAGIAHTAYGIAMLYNGLTGHADVVRQDGKAAVFSVSPLISKGPEDYEILSKLDTSEDTYVYTAEEVKNMVKVNNDKVDHAYLRNIVDSFSTEDIISRRFSK